MKNEKVIALLSISVMLFLSGCNGCSSCYNGNGDNTIVDYVPEPSLFGPNESNGIDINALELRIHEIVNELRVEYGAGELEFNKHLQAVARKYSNYMAVEGFFDHIGLDGSTPKSRYDELNFSCYISIGTSTFLTGGENLYRNYLVSMNYYVNGTYDHSDYKTFEDLAQSTVQGWMDSAAHRDNLLKPEWETEGIGVAIAENETVYITQDFC
ncbi:MAG: CAP domain-containing protein [Candidatus Micrarchaeota archaeon]